MTSVPTSYQPLDLANLSIQVASRASELDYISGVNLEVKFCKSKGHNNASTRRNVEC